MADISVGPALILCDRLITENGVHSLVGILNTIVADEIPMDYGPVWLYVRVAGGLSSDTTMRVEFKKADGPDLLVRAEGRLVVEDKPEETPIIGEVTVRLPKLPLPSTGLYDFGLFFDDNLAGTLRLPVIVKEDGDAESNGSS